MCWVHFLLKAVAFSGWGSSSSKNSESWTLLPVRYICDKHLNSLMIESILTVEAWRLGLAPMLLRKSSLSFEVFPRLEGKSPPSVNFAQKSYNEKISKIIATGEIPSSSCKIRFFCFLVFFLAGVLGILNSSVAHPNRCLALEGKLASQSKWCFGHKHKKVRYLDSCNGESVDSPRFPHCPSANYLWPALSDSWVRCQSQNLWEPFLKKGTGVISTTWKITLKQECLNPMEISEVEV